MPRISIAAIVALMCWKSVSPANEFSPILLASESGVQLWSQPRDAPGDGMSAVLVSWRTVDPSAYVKEIDSLRIENVQQFSLDLFGIITPASTLCHGLIWPSFDCDLDSGLSFNKNHIASANFDITETNDGTFGHLGQPTLPTLATPVAGIGSISMTSPLAPLRFRPEFQLNELQFAYLVTQPDVPTTTISIGVHVENLGSTRRVLFNSVPIAFVPESSLNPWQTLAVLILLRLRVRDVPG